MIEALLDLIQGGPLDVVAAVVIVGLLGMVVGACGMDWAWRDSGPRKYEFHKEDVQ